jgi:hypothetical protein
MATFTKHDLRPHPNEGIAKGFRHMGIFLQQVKRKAKGGFLADPGQASQFIYCSFEQLGSKNCHGQKILLDVLFLVICRAKLIQFILNDK